MSEVPVSTSPLREARGLPGDEERAAATFARCDDPNRVCRPYRAPLMRSGSVLQLGWPKPRHNRSTDVTRMADAAKSRSLPRAQAGRLAA